MLSSEMGIAPYDDYISWYWYGNKVIGTKIFTVRNAEFSPKEAYCLFIEFGHSDAIDNCIFVAKNTIDEFIDNSFSLIRRQINDSIYCLELKLDLHQTILEGQYLGRYNSKHFGIWNGDI